MTMNKNTTQESAAEQIRLRFREDGPPKPFDSPLDDVRQGMGRPSPGLRVTRGIPILMSKKDKERHAAIAEEVGLTERKTQKFQAVGDSRVQDPAYYIQMEEMFGIEDRGLNEI